MSTNTVTIEKKITGYSIQKEKAETEVQTEPTEPAIEHMHENVGRPEILLGSTYKIKTPLSDHALYITINDIILNPDTNHEVRRPFEIFINSKNMDHFQWVVALTRVISAVFRKGGDVTFLAEELMAVFDPKGGYFKSGGRFMPSLVAEIGDAIQTHMKTIGLVKTEELSGIQKQILAEKHAEYEAERGKKSVEGEFPESAQLCMKCYTKAMILMDGCMTCLSCGSSKCG
ncbi:TSCPD domain-containing protein [Teredinibacter franksiae]|uniref:TSCPD domain-containing protein n=1 Tax=Teredinibacter franksiae TaxID=2761453 RepID=UPI0016247D2E|nr:NrdJb [Teredinibacter franksiae]